MITSIKNLDGAIIGYLEWFVTNDNKVIDDNGKYMFIYDAWIHEDYRNTGMLKELIAKLFEESKIFNCIYVYYHKRKYKKDSKLFSAVQYLKHTRINKLFEGVI